MTENERELMERYGVTASQETVYLFNGARYSGLNDALNQAILIAERKARSMPSGAKQSETAGQEST